MHASIFPVWCLKSSCLWLSWFWKFWVRFHAQDLGLEAVSFRYPLLRSDKPAQPVPTHKDENQKYRRSKTLPTRKTRRKTNIGSGWRDVYVVLVACLAPSLAGRLVFQSWGSCCGFGQYLPSFLCTSNLKCDSLMDLIISIGFQICIHTWSAWHRAARWDILGSVRYCFVLFCFVFIFVLMRWCFDVEKECLHFVIGTKC